MDAKTKATSAKAIQQAELILHLYELRRETVMREARSYVGGEFLPASAAEFVEIVSAGGKHTAFVLQVYGYWDMVAAFVEHGALDATLVYNTCQEMYFQYAKIQPYLAEFRKKMNLPEWLISAQHVIEGSKASRKRLATMQRVLWPWPSCEQRRKKRGAQGVDEFSGIGALAPIASEDRKYDYARNQWLPATARL